jgi:hypothetical protein
MRRCLVLLALVLALPSPAAAWHRDGHFAVARVAWKQLDEGQQLAVYKLLKAHPHYEVYLADQRPKELISEMEWAFVRASTWADWVRDPMGPGLDVDLPYIHPNDEGKFDAAAIRKEILLPAYDEQGEPRHALAALEWAMKQLRSTEVADAERAVALTWLCHLVGDLHQPLHGTALIASKDTFDPPLDPPAGDRGGNLVVIRVTADSPKTTNLHFYWDSLVFADQPGIAGVDGVVAQLLADPKLRRDQLPELKATEFLAWAEESLALCKSTVYQGKDGFLKVRTLPAKQGTKSGDAPVLPDGYAEAAGKAAARRMVLAGYRLADQLHLAFNGKK